MAGEAYSRRYGSGFSDLPAQTTPVDSTFLNAVEAALLRLLGADPVDNGVQVWSASLARMVSRKLLNADIDPTAAIDKTKLAALNIADADIAAAANIAKSKLALTGSITNADIATAAAIAISKLAGYPTDATKYLRGDGSWATISVPKVVAGVVTSAGAVSAGTGFTVTKNATGDYTVTYSVAFSATPGVTVTLGPTVGFVMGGVFLSSTAAGSFRINVRDSANNPQDNAFSFVAASTGG